MKLYRIKWVDKLAWTKNKTIEGHGDWFPESHYLILDATIDHANKKYTTIHHEIEVKESEE